MTPIVGVEVPPLPNPPLFNEPNSAAFPVVGIVIYEIRLSVPPYPPAISPRIELCIGPLEYIVSNSSPKSTAFPVDAIVTYSIIFTLVSFG